MISLLQTIFVAGALLAEISSASAIPRHVHGPHHKINSLSVAAHLPRAPLSFPAIPSPIESSDSSSTQAPDADDADEDDEDDEEDEDDDDSCDADDSDDDDDDSDDSGNSDDSDKASSSSVVAAVPTTLSTATPAQVPTTSAQATTATQIPSATSSTSVSAYPTSTPVSGAFWEPAAGATWQIELSGTVSDIDYSADVFDLDLFDTPQDTIDKLHSQGKKVICYFSAGSYEDWRSDKADFQSADKGSAMDGWAGEWWLDTRTENVRKIMAARIDLASTKKCDAVDPDNVDGYSNENGVGLTSADAVDYLNFLADTAHTKGLSIGLKNTGELVNDVLDKMQFHVNESCLEYDECNLFQPFITSGKPVFHIEYPEDAPSISGNVKSEKCTSPTTTGFSTVLKTLSLDAWIDTC